MRRSKYGAVRTTVNGITFASGAEARRYAELRVLERAGQIRRIECQPKFLLHAPNGATIGKWVADFMYVECGTETAVIEDVKGVETPLFKWKRKHFEAEYGREVKVVR